MAQVYFTGAVVRVSASFTSLGVAVDPDEVNVKVKQPDETVTTYTFPTSAELVRDGVGLYHVDVPTLQDGTHRVRFVSTGTGAAAAESSFFAKSSFV